MDFKKRYNRAISLDFLENQFLPDDFDSFPEELDIEFKSQFIKKITLLGNVGSLDLKVYEIEHMSENDPRVNLSGDTFKFMAHYGSKRSLVFFISPKSENYRLSLINIDLKLEGKKITKEYSNPKRYSFYLGPDAKTHTPEDFLIKKGRVTDFQDLFSRFNVEVVTKEFFKELSNWYFWAIQNVQFPEGARIKNNGQNIAVIRLITRLIFIWFMKQKELVPDYLFNKSKIKEVLINLSNNESTYYKAILQNLFFATLNTPIKKRKFREKKDYKGINKDYGEHEFYRYEECFKNPNQILQLFKGIPFLNGGLFECLDKKREKIIIDGFSRVKKNQPIVPNCLFFSNEQLVDLNKEYGTENKIYKAEGLINILQRYHFTIDENTPSDVEIALDPELLGRVFENLLASYNPETATTARKATGSYYTPREIVNYMVEESLKAYFKTKLDKIKNIDQDLEELFSCDIETHSFNKKEVKILIEAINNLKIIDPAVGSGAFPMGILQKLVHILSKIDSHNELWKKEQIEAVEKNVPDAVLKRDLIKKIEFNFDNNELDYGRKLYLIQNCIYGVDIQSIAIQITKLRFFISLLVDENVNKGLDNMGIDPLPNLETKFVAANSLIGLQSNGQMALKDPPIQKLEDELKQVRIKYFSANDSNEKRKLREEDENIRLQLAGLLKQGGFSTEDTGKIINWDPYNLNTSSNWFDSEWMFGIKSGFDIVIANPPYVSYYSRESAKTVGTTKEIAILRGEFDFTKYERKTGRLNLWMFFVERFVKLLRMNGITAFIVDVNFTKDLARNIRRYLLENISIKQFIHNLNEFEYVASGQVILIVQKDSNILDNKIRIKDSLLGSGVQIQQSEISAPNYNLFAFTTDPIVSKLSSETKLGKLQQLQLTTGIQVGGIEIFEGKQIKDYFYQINWDYKKVFPAVDPKSVRRYSKPEFQRGIVFDYELASKITGATKKSAVVLRKYEDFLNNEKIFIRQSASEILATIGAPKTCGEYSLFSLIINNKDFDIKYLLALFNSKLYTYFAVKSGIILMERGTQPQIRKSGLEKLPIKKIPFYSQKPFIDLVDKILVITRDENYLQNSVKQVKFLEYEKQIDQMVYKLYGLGEKEIKIIENFNKN